MVEGTLCQHRYVPRFHLKFKILCVVALWTQQNGLENYRVKWLNSRFPLAISLCEKKFETIFTIKYIWKTKHNKTYLLKFLHVNEHGGTILTIFRWSWTRSNYLASHVPSWCSYRPIFIPSKPFSETYIKKELTLLYQILTWYFLI